MKPSSNLAYDSRTHLQSASLDEHLLFFHGAETDGAFQPGGDEPVTAQELLSIYAVLGDVSRSAGTEHEALRAALEAQFGIEHIARIKRRDFRAAVEFLFDLRMNGMRSRK